MTCSKHCDTMQNYFSVLLAFVWLQSEYGLNWSCLVLFDEIWDHTWLGGTPARFGFGCVSLQCSFDALDWKLIACILENTPHFWDTSWGIPIIRITKLCFCSYANIIQFSLFELDFYFNFTSFVFLTGVLSWPGLLWKKDFDLKGLPS